MLLKVKLPARAPVKVAAPEAARLPKQVAFTERRKAPAILTSAAEDQLTSTN